MQLLLFFATMTLLTGVIYPLAITAVAQLVFPRQANGSLVFKEGQVVGSELIAQAFQDPKYFWPRPSASNYNAVPSNASNLAHTNSKFPKKPSETSSGSGLDPHITLEMAREQIPRIAKARKIPALELEALLLRSGKPHLNVLLANLELNSHEISAE